MIRSNVTDASPGRWTTGFQRAREGFVRRRPIARGSGSRRSRESLMLQGPRKESVMRAKVEQWNQDMRFGTIMLFTAGLAFGLAIAHVLPQ